MCFSNEYDSDFYVLIHFAIQMCKKIPSTCISYIYYNEYHVIAKTFLTFTLSTFYSQKEAVLLSVTMASFKLIEAMKDPQ